jgi:putative FmdB family regulatory protein
MIYTFACDSCNGSFEVNVPISENQKPLSQPCQLCGVKGKVYRVFDSNGFQHEMINDFRKRAGSEWNDRLKTIKGNSGRDNIIDTY